ncbi:MAG: hypothetical protein QCH99_03950 [Candidatus Bathyarchaeota archaeon]|nr:hypothetical protein [Candidatus Bathyarchaeum tardum]
MKMEFFRFKWLLILEALFAGAYIALTRGLFIIYLSFLEYRVEEISLVLFVAAAVSLLISILLYKHLSFVVNKVKLKLTIFYVLERIVWLLMPFATNSLLVIGLFTIFTLLSSLIGIFCVRHIRLFDGNGRTGSDSKENCVERPFQRLGLWHGCFLVSIPARRN